MSWDSAGSQRKTHEFWDDSTRCKEQVTKGDIAMILDGKKVVALGDRRHPGGAIEECVKIAGGEVASVSASALSERRWRHGP